MITLSEVAADANTSLTPRPLPQRIVLVGFMGAGKSTAGRLLAQLLGWNFIDTDTLIEERFETTISAMFAAEGEQVFRRRESAALARALGEQQVVIAVGGGAPEVLTNRLLLEQTPGTAVVFLEASFALLFDRCVLQEGALLRPVLADAGAAASRFAARLPFYRRCSQHQISTERLDPEQTAAAILRQLSLS
ncbi:MAG: shikimate kinase [Janthinobacterium lividum]